jgi:hypothetical protein
MPRASHQSNQSNDVDYVKQPQYTHKKTGPPPEAEALKGYRAINSYQPLVFEEIDNAGPNLPLDLDLDDPLAFFQLFFTDELFKHLQECINAAAQEEHAGESGRPWRARSLEDLKAYVGKIS